MSQGAGEAVAPASEEPLPPGPEAAPGTASVQGSSSSAAAEAATVQAVEDPPPAPQSVRGPASEPPAAAPPLASVRSKTAKEKIKESRREKAAQDAAERKAKMDALRNKAPVVVASEAGRQKGEAKAKGEGRMGERRRQSKTGRGNSPARSSRNQPLVVASPVAAAATGAAPDAVEALSPVPTTPGAGGSVDLTDTPSSERWQGSPSRGRRRGGGWASNVSFKLMLRQIRAHDVPDADEGVTPSEPYVNFSLVETDPVHMTNVDIATVRRRQHPQQRWQACPALPGEPCPAPRQPHAPPPLPPPLPPPKRTDHTTPRDTPAATLHPTVPPPPRCAGFDGCRHDEPDPSELGGAHSATRYPGELCGRRGHQGRRHAHGTRVALRPRRTRRRGKRDGARDRADALGRRP